jgi:hypothetical protein
MAFPKDEKVFIEAYIEEMVPKIIAQNAKNDALKGIYSPPVWSNERDEAIRILFGERGVSSAEIENMIKIGRENFKSITTFYNKMYEEYQQHEAQAA